MISFGIEFEFDTISNPSYQVCQLRQRAVDNALVDGFTYQIDITAGTEVSTPVLTDVRQAAEKISRFWRRTPRRYSPLMKGHAVSESMGQHIHIGLPSRRLMRHEKTRIALHAKSVYPFLVAIHANDQRRGHKSYRGGHSRYCVSLDETTAIGSSHYTEISDSHNGTVEFRKFDSNIPQVSLTCATILKVVALAGLKGSRRRVKRIQTITGDSYAGQMQKAVVFGLSALNVDKYLKHIFEYYAPEWRELLSEEEVPACVWEVLHLARSEICVSDLVVELGIEGDHRREYIYYREMCENSGQLFQNFMDDVSQYVGMYNPLNAPVNVTTERSSLGRRERLGPTRRLIMGLRMLGEGVPLEEIRYEIRERTAFPRQFELDMEIINRLWLASRDGIEAYNREVVERVVYRSAVRALLDLGEEIVTSSTNISTDISIVRLSSLSESQCDDLAEIVNRSLDEIISAPERYYVALHGQAIVGVARAHVACSCSPGEVLLEYCASDDVRTRLLMEINQAMREYGRTISMFNEQDTTQVLGALFG